VGLLTSLYFPRLVLLREIREVPGEVDEDRWPGWQIQTKPWKVWIRGRGSHWNLPLPDPFEILSGVGPRVRELELNDVEESLSRILATHPCPNLARIQSRGGTSASNLHVRTDSPTARNIRVLDLEFTVNYANINFLGDWASMFPNLQRLRLVVRRTASRWWPTNEAHLFVDRLKNLRELAIVEQPPAGLDLSGYDPPVVLRPSTLIQLLAANPDLETLTLNVPNLVIDKMPSEADVKEWQVLQQLASKKSLPLESLQLRWSKDWLYPFKAETFDALFRVFPKLRLCDLAVGSSERDLPPAGQEQWHWVQSPPGSGPVSLSMLGNIMDLSSMWQGKVVRLPFGLPLALQLSDAVIVQALPWETKEFVERDVQWTGPTGRFGSSDRGELIVQTMDRLSTALVRMFKGAKLGRFHHPPAVYDVELSSQMHILGLTGACVHVDFQPWEPGGGYEPHVFQLLVDEKKCQLISPSSPGTTDFLSGLQRGLKDLMQIDAELEIIDSFALYYPLVTRVWKALLPENGEKPTNVLILSYLVAVIFALLPVSGVTQGVILHWLGSEPERKDPTNLFTDPPELLARLVRFYEYMVNDGPEQSLRVYQPTAPPASAGEALRAPMQTQGFLSRGGRPLKEDLVEDLVEEKEADKVARALITAIRQSTSEWSYEAEDGSLLRFLPAAANNRSPHQKSLLLVQRPTPTSSSITHPDDFVYDLTTSLRELLAVEGLLSQVEINWM